MANKGGSGRKIEKSKFIFHAQSSMLIFCLGIIVTLSIYLDDITDPVARWILFFLIACLTLAATSLAVAVIKTFRKTVKLFDK